MGHWAKIENDIVVNVIVADAEFISTQDGEWIETDSNVHYGNDGLPDNVTTTRMNFAAIGCIYNRLQSKFYDPIPPAPTGWVFNEETLCWIPDLTNEDA